VIVIQSFVELPAGGEAGLRILMTSYAYADDDLDLLVLTGSHAYGCATPESDKDYRGFRLAPAKVLLGLETWEQTEYPGEDKVVYNLTKFMKLLLKGSPNTIEILFAEPENVVQASAIGIELLQNAHRIVAKTCIAPLVGFAQSSMNESYKADNKISLKKASHAIRMLGYAEELLISKTITLNSGSEVIKDIRQGKINVVDRCDIFVKKYANIGYLERISNLRDTPDREWVDDFLLRCYKQRLCEDLGLMARGDS
jgi:uncharacterized protein